MDDGKHTATPWFVCGDPGHEPQSDSWYLGRTIGSVPEGTRVCDMTPLRNQLGREADARFIVRAVNAHDDLIAALDNAEAVMSIVEPRSDKAQYLDALEKIRAALAKATP